MWTSFIFESTVYYLNNTRNVLNKNNFTNFNITITNFNNFTCKNDP